MRAWLNELGRICQCSAQEKDAKRAEDTRRCCAVGRCCHEVLSAEIRKDARSALRAALTCAVEDQIIARNPAAVKMRLSSRREPRRKRRAWTVDEAREFLESARRDGDVLYAAYVLVLILGLRKGELLGLTWKLVDLDTCELYVGEQLQRVGRQLIRSQTKTETSEARLPFPDPCATALKLRQQQQDADHERAGRGWIDTGLVFTTRQSTPTEPPEPQPQLRRARLRGGLEACQEVGDRPGERVGQVPLEARTDEQGRIGRVRHVSALNQHLRHRG
jgi:integrase